MDRDLKRESPFRRITRQSQNKGNFPLELRPRAALKRKSAIPAVTTKDESAAGEGSPDKISKLDIVAGDGGNGHENVNQNKTVDMDVEEHEDQNQDMSSEDENEDCEPVMKTKPLRQEETVIRTQQVENLENTEVIWRRRNIHQKSQGELPKLTGSGDAVHGSQTIARDFITEPYRRGSASVNPRPLENKTDILTVRSSIRNYQKKMAEKARGVSDANLQGRDRCQYVKGYTTHTHKTNNFPAKKQSLPHTKTELRKKVIANAGSASTSRANTCGVCRWLLWPVLLLASLALGLMGYQHFPSSARTTDHQNSLLHSETFETHLAELKPLFPSQRPELWKRTEIHLMRHLNLSAPTEPVSLILTSGRGAERTLGCLAQKLATTFSSTLNSSFLSINGTEKKAQDSDQVKLHIDKVLQEAFKGGTQAAVIHHFEELPPGSTLIFYRYCDHENAAFKKVLLVFTVMLPIAELDFKLSLTAVEEQVHEYVKEKFVSSDRSVEFNQMDVDKLSGLWSRISHLILPVAAEQKIEQYGCGE